MVEPTDEELLEFQSHTRQVRKAFARFNGASPTQLRRAFDELRDTARGLQAFVDQLDDEDAEGG